MRAVASFPDLRQRAVWGAAIGAAALALIVVGGAPAAMFAALAGSAAAAEFRLLTAPTARDAPLYATAVGAAALAAHLWSAPVAIAALACAAAAFAAADLASRRAPGWGLAGFATVGLAAVAFVALRDLEGFGLATALWIGAVVVATDVGAYFAGRLIGGPKLWPEVSPKKTWAGLGGGIALAFVVGALFSVLTTGTYVEQVCAVSAAAALVAQGGDLAESALKRRFGAKDSSALIPGHGGALDRLDGFCAATLVVAAATFARGAPVFAW
ncbi:MAG: phosphatidate cytidylyltransferase [Rubrimonas sp.]|uniref:phosphatidate cytidylyltransferase n=1 Tax=Rubrimonas sp. TaxID=2036015 RepID=UPI002FDDDF4E